ncbi:hypothetical protein [Paraliobacillus ryukyuensis]|uniref:hypothetical protein n=1 Tax=Paraliobacillus ryukyuensis TaxID=200904 RepID=UPI001474043C|nr:hypothetical protein [Paraliobacillus ryukyuensis]
MNPSTIQDYQRSHIIDQLAKHGFYDVERLTYEELQKKLTVRRAKNIKVEAPANKFF